MMLAASTLTNATAALSAAIFSPSRTTCKKRVSQSRFRYEPYGARVLSAIPVDAPAKFAYAAVAAGISAPAPVEYTAPSASSPMKATQPAAAAVAAAAAVVASAAPAPRFAIVRFKHESATFVAPFKIAAGDLVVVEGDRGENIGVVAEITKEAVSYDVPNKVLRRATDKDREALAAQREREAAAVVSTRALAESLGLHGRVEDAEYQFDLNKLTIFVRRPSKSTFVDFRKLQRSLFREFRCRIWCAYMDEVETAEAAPRCK